MESIRYLLFLSLSNYLLVVLSYTECVFGLSLGKEEKEASTLCSSSWVRACKLICSIGRYSQMTLVTLEEAG